MGNSNTFKASLTVFVFSAIAQVATTQGLCGGHLLSQEGVIQSPNYPSSYPPETDCDWMITVATGSQVALTFQSFILEPHEECGFDFVEVRDGLHVNSGDVLALLCGSEIPEEIRSTSNYMRLRFHSDKGVHMTGFSATYIAVNMEEFAGLGVSKGNLIKWFLNLRKNGTTTKKWGKTNLSRTATALYLSDRRFFLSGNRTGDEMGYELSLELMSRLLRQGKLNSNELAMYIHAMMVTCINPRSFYGHDLVSELRAWVESSSNFTNPFDLLVLCNAGDKMSVKDVERISTAYDSQHRPFWTDNQAMALIALACVSDRSDVIVDERNLRVMSQELKKYQFRNGTVENLKTTALVVQALIATQSYEQDFDYKSAIKSILQSQTADGSIGSFLDSYYVLPVLSNTTLLNITSQHCKYPSTSKEEALGGIQRAKSERFSIQYSVWIGSEVDARKTWFLMIPVNSTLYDIIEIAETLDTAQQVNYNVIAGKPYVSSFTGLQDDVEIGLYWFIYVRTQNSEENPQLVEESPVDVNIRPNQELILWYKAGQWNTPAASGP